MQSKSNLKQFRSELTAAMGCVGTGQLPCAGLLHIETKDGQTIIMANNLDYGVKVKVESEDVSPGVAVVSAPMVNAWSSRAEGETVSIKTNAKMVLSAGAARCLLPTQSPDSFPLFPKPTSTLAKIPGGELARILSGVLPVINANAAGRFSYAGAELVFDKDKKGLTVAAIDQNHMAFADVTIPIVNATEKCILPRKGVSEVIKQVGKYTEEVTVGISENSIFFAIGKRVLYVRRLQDQFPSWRKLLDALKGQSVIEIDSSKMIAALGRAAALQDQSKRVIVGLSGAGGTINVAAGGVEGSEVFELPYKGQEVSFAINGEWLSEALRIVGEKAEIAFISESKAIEIRPRGSLTYRNLIMPMSR